ncbi:MAG: DUF4136 domain-containing protein [Prolixibacteraceae bacterium]
MEFQKLHLVVYGLLVAVSLSSCYPDEIDETDDLDVVVTQYDEDFNFDTKQYYLLPDTVTVITDNESYEKSQQELALDATILDEIDDQMQEAGYMKLAPADTSDATKMQQAVIMLASRSTVAYTNYYFDYYYSGRRYWNWYYGFDYYYPGYYYNYHYPWGYPATYSYSYAVGTVIIEMVDPINPFTVDEDNREVSYEVRWLAILNGLAEMSYENTEKRVTAGIIQAFNQSPYLY